MGTAPSLPGGVRLTLGHAQDRGALCKLVFWLFMSRFNVRVVEFRQHMADGHRGVETVFSGRLVAPEPRLSQRLPPGSQVTVSMKHSRGRDSSQLPWALPSSLPRDPSLSFHVVPSNLSSASLSGPFGPCFPWLHAGSFSLRMKFADLLPLPCLGPSFVKQQPWVRTSQPLLVCKSPERLKYL